MVSVKITTIIIVNVTYLVVGITCPLIIIIGRKLRRPPMQWFEFGDLQHSALNIVALCSFYVLWTWMMWRWSELSSQSLSLCRERYHSILLHCAAVQDEYWIFCHLNSNAVHTTNMHIAHTWILHPNIVLCSVQNYVIDLEILLEPNWSLQCAIEDGYLAQLGNDLGNVLCNTNALFNKNIAQIPSTSRAT